MNAGLALQRWVFARLADDGVLAGLLGGPKIFDQSAAAAAFPYVTFGRTSIYDWSTGTEKGAEQIFSLHVWSKARGKSECLAIMDRVRNLIEDAHAELDGHALVNLRLEFAEARFDEDIAVHHGLLRFRAVTDELG